MWSWFKKMTDEETEYNENSIPIKYNGKHEYHLSDMRKGYSFESEKEYCDLYINGKGNVKFTIGNIDYDFNISPFTFLEKYNSISEGYLGAINMDKNIVEEKLREEIIDEVSKGIKNIGIDKEKDLFEKNKRLDFKFTIDVKESDIIEK